jgi:hypothetical protein
MEVFFYLSSTVAPAAVSLVLVRQGGFRFAQLLYII